MEKNNCSDCKFRDKNGFCHRFPPMGYPNQWEATNKNHRISIWTDPENYCGEWINK